MASTEENILKLFNPEKWKGHINHTWMLFYRHWKMFRHNNVVYNVYKCKIKHMYNKICIYLWWLKYHSMKIILHTDHVCSHKLICTPKPMDSGRQYQHEFFSNINTVLYTFPFHTIWMLEQIVEYLMCCITDIRTHMWQLSVECLGPRVFDPLISTVCMAVLW